VGPRDEAVENDKTEPNERGNQNPYVESKDSGGIGDYYQPRLCCTYVLTRDDSGEPAGWSKQANVPL
jgi:hypothetical protein